MNSLKNKSFKKLKIKCGDHKSSKYLEEMDKLFSKDVIKNILFPSKNIKYFSCVVQDEYFIVKISSKTLILVIILIFSENSNTYLMII